MYKILITLCLTLTVFAQDRSNRALKFDEPELQQTKSQRVKPRPVAILRYINRLNDDGSYTYGYNSEDGSYKIETRYADGQVKGQYGYYDENGQFQEISYGASKRGFEPVVPGVEVAPPTLVDNSRRGQQQSELSDYDYEYYDETPQQLQQQQQPKIPLTVRNLPDGSHSVPGQYSVQFSPTIFNTPNQQRPQRQPVAPRPQPVAPRPQPAAPRRQPAARNLAPNIIQAHPFLTNFDINTGSYSLRYTG